MITFEQEDFLTRVLDIPFVWSSWKRLVTLDTLHAYCGGPIPTPEAQRLDKIARIQQYFCFPIAFFFSNLSHRFCFKLFPLLLFQIVLSLTSLTFSEMEPIKNKQAQVKKSTALSAKQATDIPPSSSVSQKRKSSSNGGLSPKRAHNLLAPSFALDYTSPILEPCLHYVGKGLMISQGPLAIPPLIHLLVKSLE